MKSRIFVNLPVKDLPRSVDFYKALGFGIDPRFTDDTAACVVLGEDQYAMLLTREKFAEFTPTPIVDADEATEVLVALSCGSRAEVEERVDRAVAAGGSLYAEPKDHGFMYQHGFRDPDGHIWEIFWMDLAAFERMRGAA